MNKQLEYQRKISHIITNLMKDYSPDRDFVKYQTVMAVVFCMIQRGKLKDLDLIVRAYFPQYFTSKPPLHKVFYNPN